MADRGISKLGNGGCSDAREAFETDDVEEKFAALGRIPLDPRVAQIAKKYPTVSDLEEALETREFKSLPLEREELRREWRRWQRPPAKRQKEKEAERRAAKLSAQWQQIEAVLGGEEPNTRPIVPIDENRWPWVLNWLRTYCSRRASTSDFTGAPRANSCSISFGRTSCRLMQRPRGVRPTTTSFLRMASGARLMPCWSTALRCPRCKISSNATYSFAKTLSKCRATARRNWPNAISATWPLAGACAAWRDPQPFSASRRLAPAQTGFDQQTGLYLDSDGDWLAPVGTDAEALARVKAILLEPLAGFPISDQEKSVVVAAQLTGLERRLLASAPAFAIDSSVRSAGKSLLSDYIAITVTGHRPSTIHYDPKDEELVKRLDAALLEGDAVIKLDNITTLVKHPRLAQIITEEILKVRLFGTLQNVNVLTNLLVLLTGNHLHFGWDMPTRVLQVKIIIETEHPERRTFAIPRLRQWALRNRRRQVNALLAVAYAYHAANRPKINLSATRFDSDDWTEMVRKPLIYAGFVDPVPSESNVEVSNPEKDDMAAVLSAWYAAQPTAEALTCKELIDLAEQVHTAGSDQLKNALAQVAGDGRGNIDTRRLGTGVAFKRTRRSSPGS